MSLDTYEQLKLDLLGEDQTPSSVLGKKKILAISHTISKKLRKHNLILLKKQLSMKNVGDAPKASYQ